MIARYPFAPHSFGCIVFLSFLFVVDFTFLLWDAGRVAFTRVLDLQHPLAASLFSILPVVDHTYSTNTLSSLLVANVRWLRSSTMSSPLGSLLTRPCSFSKMWRSNSGRPGVFAMVPTQDVFCLQLGVLLLTTTVVNGQSRTA